MEVIKIGKFENCYPCLIITLSLFRKHNPPAILLKELSVKHGKYSSTWFRNFLKCWSGPTFAAFSPQMGVQWPCRAVAAVLVCHKNGGAWEWALPSSLAPQGEPVLAQPLLLLRHRLECRGKQEDSASIWLLVWCPTNFPLTSPDTSAHCPGNEGAVVHPQKWCKLCLRAIFPWKYLCQFHRTVSCAQDTFFF